MIDVRYLLSCQPYSSPLPPMTTLKTNRKFEKKYIRENDLKTMCLNVICDNIKLFILAEKEALKEFELPLLFLRRVYSDKLFSICECRLSMPMEFLPWLISPYWKETFLNYSPFFDVMINKLKLYGSALTSLNLKGCSAPPEYLIALITCVPNLERLSLESTFCNENVLSAVGKSCKTLRILNVSECMGVTDSAIIKLCNPDRKETGLKFLKELNLMRTGVTDGCIPTLLKHFTSLEYVKYEFFSKALYNIHRGSLYKGIVPTQYNFRTLEYFEMHGSDSELCKVLDSWNKLCPKVSRILINRELCDPELLQYCTAFPNLREFLFCHRRPYVNFRDLTQFFILRGSKLTLLRLDFAFVSVEAIAKYCPNLEKLHLSNVLFEDVDKFPTDFPHDVPVLKNLQLLGLYHMKFQNISHLQSFNLLLQVGINVSELNLQYSENVSEDVALLILELPNLLAVDFNSSDIESSVLLHFFDSPNVMRITVENCPNVPASEEKSGISKFLGYYSLYGNTLSWKINYKEQFRGFVPKNHWTSDFPI